MLIRRVVPRSSIWVHAAFQLCSYILAIAAMATGIWLALDTSQLHTTHATIGLIVVSLLALQPVLGLLQHSHYKKASSRGAFGLVHIVLGTFLILLGIVNGGLGLKLAEEEKKYKIAYAIVAAVLGVVYAAIVVVTMLRKRRTAPVKVG